MNRHVALTLAAVALAACSPDFDPASKVEGLRVLAIKAEPPEIDPGGLATLESLVLPADVDAEAAGTTTVVHVACVPVPGSAAPTECVRFETFRDFGALVAQLAASACAAPAGTAAPFLAGIEACRGESCGAALAGAAPLRRAEVGVPASYFGGLAAADPALVLGVQSVVLSFALDATPDELVQGVVTTCPEADLVAGLARLWPEREHVLAVKRLAIRGPRSPDPRNENPSFGGIDADRKPLEPDLATTVDGGTVTLDPVDLGTPEPYTELDAAGRTIRTRSEEWVFSWFATRGEMEDLHTDVGEREEWTVGGAAAGAPAIVVAVVRDLRGGVGWQVRRVRVKP